MKQTAVEWLECEIKKLPFIDPVKAFDQAKQMEKQQKEEEYLRGYGEGYDEGLYDAEYK